MVEPSVFRCNPGIAKRWDNFYIPPNFDASKAVKIERKEHQTQRSMAPTHIRCSKCGHLLRKGTKQYSKVKKSTTEDYMTLPIFYISFRCTDCKTEMALKTDPENNFYLPLKGCTLPFLEFEQERWRQEDGVEEPNEDLNLDQLQKLEKQALESRALAENDEYIEDKLLEDVHISKLDPSKIADNLRLADMKREDAFFQDKETQAVKNFQKLKLEALNTSSLKNSTNVVGFAKLTGVGKKKKKDNNNRITVNPAGNGMQAVKKKKKKKKKKSANGLAGYL